MDLLTYSESRVGEQWREEDHVFLVTHMDKVDRLTQDIYDRRKTEALVIAESMRSGRER